MSTGTRISLALGMYVRVPGALAVVLTRLPVGLSLWIPAQILNFWLVPPAMRILFVYCTEFVWSVMISWISARADERKAQQELGGPTE